MEEEKRYSRGFVFLILFVFMLLLGALAIISNTKSSGFATSADKEVKVNINKQDCCSGFCSVGYRVIGQEQINTMRCDFNNNKNSKCLCEVGEVPSESEGVGNLYCNVYYHGCYN